MSNYFPQNAQTDFAAASSYDENRPSYTTQSVNKLLEELQVTSKPGAKILDLAAGTGKFTELLAAREEKYDVIAVEPHAKMREVLEKKNLQGVKVLDGTATDIKDVEGGWADAVVVAQVGTI